MRFRSSWNVAIVLAAVSLTVALQLAGATETSAAIGGSVTSGAVANTAALEPDGGAGIWSAFVAIVFLVVANIVALGRRQPMRRAEEPPSPSPWERLVAARY